MHTLQIMKTRTKGMIVSGIGVLAGVSVCLGAVATDSSSPMSFVELLVRIVAVVLSILIGGASLEAFTEFYQGGDS